MPLATPSAILASAKTKMAEARAKYGSSYIRKNDYEEFSRRFGWNDPI